MNTLICSSHWGSFEFFNLFSGGHQMRVLLVCSIVAGLFYGCGNMANKVNSETYNPLQKGHAEPGVKDSIEVEHFILEGVLEAEYPCIYGARHPDPCLRLVGGEPDSRHQNGLYYLLGPRPEFESIIYEVIYDRSVIDDRGYPLEIFKVTDTVTGVSFNAQIGQKWRLQIEIDNESGMGFGGAIAKVLNAKLVE